MEIFLFKLPRLIGHRIDKGDDFAPIDLLKLLRVPMGHVSAADESEFNHD
jgi:hypothetical protein